MRRLLTTLALLTTTSLAACADRDVAVVPPAAHATPAALTTPGPAPMGTLKIAIAIPATKKSSASGRSPQYISPNTGSIAVTLTGTSSMMIVTPATVVASLAGKCAPEVAFGNIITCNIQMEMPIGEDVFTYATYQSADGSGTPLSMVTNYHQILHPGVNGQRVNLNPVVANLAWSPAFGSAITGKAGYQNETLQAFDASGALILAPGNYVTPAGVPDTISASCQAGLTLQDGSGGAITTANMTSPAGNTIGRVAYDGSGTNGQTLTCTATDTSPTPHSATFSLGLGATATISNSYT